MDIDGNPVDLNNRRTFYTGTDEGMEEGGECKAELSPMKQPTIPMKISSAAMTTGILAA